MSVQLKLIEKLQRILRSIKDGTRGKYDRMDLREEVMAWSPRVLATMRGQQRRLDADFGRDAIAQEPLLAVDMEALDFDRHDFDGFSDFGVRMTLASGLVASLGLQAGDMVAVKEGEYAGMTVEIESVDSTLDELRFADDATKATETFISATIRISSAT